MTSLFSSILTSPGRLMHAVSGLYWLRIIFTLMYVLIFLFCADTELVAAKNPRAQVPGQYKPGVQKPTRTMSSPPLDLSSEPIYHDYESGAEVDEAQDSAAAQPPSVKPTVQAPAPSAEIILDPQDKEYEIIIEKNIFSPERKKWVSEPAASKQATQKMAKKEINELILLGTVINRDNRYAVLRTKKDANKGGFKPSMKGDYIQGYLVKEIEEKKVTLQDDADNTEYVLFINDDKKERVAEKTAVKAEPAKAAVAVEDKKTVPPVNKQKGRRPGKQLPIPADAPDVVKKAMGKKAEQEEIINNTPPNELPETNRKSLDQSEVPEE